MVAGGYKVWLEVTGIYGPFPADMPAAARGRVANGEARRMDLVGVTTDLRGECVDPSLRDTAAPTVLARQTPAEVLAAAEAVKDAHYADTPEPFAFTAFAAGMETNLGPAATKLLNDLSMRIARRRNEGRNPRIGCCRLCGATRARAWAVPLWRSWRGRSAPPLWSHQAQRWRAQRATGTHPGGPGAPTLAHAAPLR